MSDELKESSLSELLLWLLRRRRRLRVAGDSMIPLLKPGEEILIDPNAYQKKVPRINDIVVVKHPHRGNLLLVKRVVSVSEDQRCFLKGDNWRVSTDSRSFGAVKLEQILGRVTSRFFN